MANCPRCNSKLRLTIFKKYTVCDNCQAKVTVRYPWLWNVSVSLGACLVGRWTYFSHFHLAAIVTAIVGGIIVTLISKKVRKIFIV